MEAPTNPDIQACREIVEWWDTGLLDQSGELRRRAEENEWSPGDVRRAEKELMERLVRWVAEGGPGVVLSQFNDLYEASRRYYNATAGEEWVDISSYSGRCVEEANASMEQIKAALIAAGATEK